MTTDAVEFSVVVPTYNRPKGLANCLAAIAGLNYPKANYEVIVVDDGSEPRPDSIIDSYREQVAITFLTQPRCGPAYARNAGVAAALGRFVAFVDDDCAPHTNWLYNLAAQFEVTPNCLLGGHTVNVLTANPYASASQDLIDFLYSWFNTGPKGPTFFTSNNMAVPADKFRELGGFDSTFLRAAGEDRDFCDHWVNSGAATAHVPGAIVYHAHLMNFSGFVGQHFNYGRGAYRFHQARARRGNERVRMEPAGFYANLLLHPLRQPRRGLENLRILFLIIVTQVANVGGYFWERWIVKP
jgi:glycosyltransferase involved in cell wall biosynthesis